MHKWCEKAVYNLRKGSCISNEQSSTPIPTHIIAHTTAWGLAPFLHLLSPVSSPLLSTRYIALIPLLNTFFTQFPQHLLITTTKEN